MEENMTNDAAVLEEMPKSALIDLIQDYVSRNQELERIKAEAETQLAKTKDEKEQQNERIKELESQPYPGQKTAQVNFCRLKDTLRMAIRNAAVIFLEYPKEEQTAENSKREVENWEKSEIARVDAAWTDVDQKLLFFPYFLHLFASIMILFWNFTGFFYRKKGEMEGEKAIRKKYQEWKETLAEREEMVKEREQNIAQREAAFKIMAALLAIAVIVIIAMAYVIIRS